MVTKIQTAFSKGEIAPELFGRVDSQMYLAALATARNVVCHGYGGVSNRAGLRYLGPVKTHTQTPSFIRFKFKSSDTYLLEFGNLYMRVIRENGHVTEAAKTITGITAANPPVVTTSADHGYVNGDEIYIAGVAGMTQVNGRRFLAAGVTATTFQLNDQITNTAVNGSGYSAYTSGGTAARVYTLVTPYAIADVPNIKFAQAADVMTLVHQKYAPRELTRTAHDAWALTTLTFRPTITAPIDITVGSSTSLPVSATFTYKVTSVDAITGEESLPGRCANGLSLDGTITGATKANPCTLTVGAAWTPAVGQEVYISGVNGMTELNNRQFFMGPTNLQLVAEDSTEYGTYAGGGVIRLCAVMTTATTGGTVSWTGVNGAENYNIYKSIKDSSRFGFIGSTTKLTFEDTNITPDYSKGPPTDRNPFLGPKNYPATVGYYEQRRVFGGSSDQPDTSFYSKIGASSSFSPSFPTQADDAIQATLVSNTVNEIRHYVAKRDLMVLTEDAEWAVNSGPDSGFSPDTVKQKVQSEWGSSHLRPQVIGDTTLFVPVNLREVRSLEYSFQTNGYETSNVTTLASHMFRDSRMVDWASVKSPDPLVVAVREDGDAPVLTLDVKADAVAWARWDTLGNFERVGTARAFADDSDDTIYFVVKRKINGQTVRTIEYIADRLLTDVRDSFFVDCGVTYDAPVTISGSTAANPVVVNATAHGFANGDYVDISDIIWEPAFDSYDTESQPAQLNLTRFKVKNVTANTFELTDQSDVNINGTGFTAYVSGGKARKAVTTISGLWHLVNTPVTVLADGVPVTGHTVSSTGTITLATRASRVHIGLKYTSDVETLNVEAAQGTAQGKPAKISQVTGRFAKSRGVYYGRDFTKMHELKQTDFGTLGATPGLYTGDIPMDLPPDWKSNGRVAFRQRLPLPMSISAIIPDVEFGR